MKIFWILALCLLVTTTSTILREKRADTAIAGGKLNLYPFNLFKKIKLLKNGKLRFAVTI